MSFDDLFTGEALTGPYAGVGTPGGGAHFPDVLSFDPAMLGELPFLGVDGQFDPVTVDMTNDSPHVLINAGTGGGKSVIGRSLFAQHLARGALGVVLDYKRISQRWVKDLHPVARVSSTLPDIALSVLAMGEEVHRRNDVIDAWNGPIEDAPVGPPVVVLFEELNATMDHLKTLSGRVPKGTYTAMDAFRDIVLMGRAAKFHVIATAQLASWRASGGADILVNFNTRILLRYDETSWRWLVGGPFQSPPVEQGRGMVCQAGLAKKVQFLHMTEGEARALVLGSESARLLARSRTHRMNSLPEPWRLAVSPAEP